MDFLWEQCLNAFCYKVAVHTVYQCLVKGRGKFLKYSFSEQEQAYSIACASAKVSILIQVNEKRRFDKMKGGKMGLFVVQKGTSKHLREIFILDKALIGIGK